MANLDSNLQTTVSLTNAGTHTLTFNTENKYVNNNIQVILDVDDTNLVPANIAKDVTILGVTGTYGGTSGTYTVTDSGVSNISAYAAISVPICDITPQADITIATSNFTGASVSTNSSGYYVKLNGSGGITTNSAGWLSTSNENTTTQIQKYLNIPAASAEINASKQATAPTIAALETSIDGAYNINSTITTSIPESGHYIAVQATAPATTNIPISIITHTAGYLNNSSQISANNIATTAKTGSTYYMSINDGSVTPLLSHTNLTTYFDEGTSESYDMLLKPQYTNTQGYIEAHSTAQSGASQYFSIKKVTPSISGGTFSNQNAYITYTNATFVANSNVSGVAISPQSEIDCSAVSYNSTYTGWVNNLSGQIIGATSSTWEGDTYYLSGIELQNDTDFDLTIPNGDGGKLTLHFSVDGEGNTTIT